MARGDSEALTHLERRFCEVYTSDPHISATQAAKDAGYRPKSAAGTATDIMKYERVRKEIARLNQDRFDRLDYHAMETLRELIKVAHSDVNDLFEEVEMDTGEEDFLGEPIKRRVRRLRGLDNLRNSGAIASIKQGAHGVEVKFWDKTKALDILAKRYKLITDKVEVDINHKGQDLSKLSLEELATLKTLQEKINNGS